MVQSAQHRADLAAVARDADPGVVVGTDNIVNDGLSAAELCLAGLAFVAFPERILLRESRLETIPGKQACDVGPVRPLVACAHADALTEMLLYHRNERAVRWEGQTIEGEVGRRGAPRQRASIV